MKVAIIGTGYVGLTTGVCLAFLEHDVVCVDTEESKVGVLRTGVTPIFEPFLSPMLGDARLHLRFTTSYAEAIPWAEVVFIAVGTPPSAGGGPDLRYLRAAAEGIGENLGEGFTVVVNKSTVPIGSGNWVDALVRESFEKAHGIRPNG